MKYYPTYNLINNQPLTYDWVKNSALKQEKQNLTYAVFI